MTEVRAETKHRLKMDQALSSSSKKRSPHEARLEAIIQNSNTQQQTGVRPPSKRMRNDPHTLKDAINALFARHPPAEHPQIYSVRELVQYFCDGNINSPIYQKPHKTVFRIMKQQQKFTLACSYETLNRKISNYKMNNELPPLNDFGTRVGRKSVVPTSHLPKLVEGLSESAGRAQTPQEFAAKVAAVQESQRTEAGLPSSLQPKTACDKTVEYLRRKASILPGVTPILPTSVRGQTWKRDVAMHSFRNVLSQADYAWGAI
jgi:hypothetical protein